MKKIEKEFEQIATFIKERRNGTIGFLNYATVSTYWTIGAYVSTRVKSKAWGMGSVLQLCDYLKTRHPKLRGFGQRQIYNMVEFYDTFATADFAEIRGRLKLDDFVVGYGTADLASDGLQSSTANLKNNVRTFLQLPTAQLDDVYDLCSDFPMFLTLRTFTNHIEILNRCRRKEGADPQCISVRMRIPISGIISSGGMYDAG